MKKIKNGLQLREEIDRLKNLSREQERSLKEDIRGIKEDMKPENLILNGIASMTGIKIDKKNYFRDGLAYAISVVIQRFVLKTERKVEERAYDFIDGLFDRIKVFLDKFTSHDARREQRREEK